MTDSMKFGPEWLRNMSNDNLNNTTNNTSSYNNNTSTGGGGSGGGGGGNNTIIGPRYQLAEYRYGREEMLSLYDKNTKTPEILPSYKKLFVDKLQCPLALIPTTDEDSPPAQPGGGQPRPWGVLRSPVFGTATSIRGTGRGGSVDRGRGSRTRGTFHTSSSYQRPTALYDEDIRGIGKTSGDRWHERNGISDSIGQLTNDWNGSPSSSPRKEFAGNSMSHSGTSGNVTVTGGGTGSSGGGGRGSNMENWRRTRMDEDSIGGSGSGSTGINTSGNTGINEGWRGGTGGNLTGPGSTYRWARSTSWRDDDTNNVNSSTNETQLSNSGISGIGSIQRSFSTTSTDLRSSSTGINSGSTSAFLGSSSHQIQGSVGGTISSMKQQHSGSGRSNVQWCGSVNSSGNDNLGTGDHEDSSLPEWAMANPTDSGGTFDATGAFHGSNDEDDDSGGKIGMGDTKLIRLNSNNEINKNNYITNGSKDGKSLINTTNSTNDIKNNHNKIDSTNKDSQLIKDKKLSENKLIKNIEKNNSTISNNNNFNSNNSTINVNDNSNTNENNINKKLSKAIQLGNDVKKSDNKNNQKHEDLKSSTQISIQQSSLPATILLNTNNNKFLEISDRMQEVADDMVAKLITDDESVSTMKKLNSSNSSSGGGGVGVGSGKTNQMLKTNSTTSSTIVEQIHHHHHNPKKSQQQQSQEHQSSLTNPTTSHSTLISPSVIVQQQQQQQQPSSSSSSNNATELWYYRDPQGKVQGSFTATEMAEWYRAGYFDENLYVRRICDSRFAALGELVKLCGNSMPFLSSNLIPPLTETLSQPTTLQQQQQQHNNNNNHLPHQQQLTPQQNAHQLHNISGQQQHIGAPGINQLPSSHQQQSPTQQQQQQHPIPGVVSAINAALNKNIITPLLVDGNSTGQQQQSTNLETLTLIQQFHYLQKQYTLKQRSQIIQNLTNSDTWNLLTREQQQQIINQRLSQIIYPDYLMNLQALSNTLGMGTPASYTLQQMLAGAKNEIIQTKITPHWLYNSLGIGQQQQQHHNIGSVGGTDTISSIFNNNEFTTGTSGAVTTSSSATIVDNQINVNNLLQQSSNNHQLAGNAGQLSSSQISNHQNNTNNSNNNSGVTSVDNDPIKSLFMQLQMQKNAAAFASLASAALTGGGNTINHWPTNLPNHLQQSHQQQQESPAWSTVASSSSSINQQQTVDILNQSSSINMWDYTGGISSQQQNNKLNEMKTEQQIIEEQVHNDKINRQTNNDNNDIDKYIQHNVVTHHYQDQQQQYKHQQNQDLPLEQQQLSSYNIQSNKKDERNNNNKNIIDEKNLQQHKSNNNQQKDDELLSKQQQKNNISGNNGKNNTDNGNINLINNKKDNNKKPQQQINDDDRNKRELVDDKRKQKEEKKQRQQQIEEEQRKRQLQEEEKRREQQQIEEEKRQKDIEAHRRRVLLEAYQVASDNKKQQQQQRSSGPSSVAPWSNTGLPGITSPGPNFAEIQKAERERRAEEQRLEQLLETQRKTQQMEIIAAKETTTLKWKSQSALINNVKSLNEIQAEEAKRLANEQAALAIAEQIRRKDHEQQSAAVAQSSSSSGFSTNPFNTIWNSRTTQNIVWNSNNNVGNIISSSSSSNNNNNNSNAANSNINTAKVWGGTSTSSAGFWEEPTKITSSSTNHTTAASVLANAIQQQHGNKIPNRIGLIKSQTIGSMQTVRKDNNNTTIITNNGGSSNSNFKQQISSNKQQNKNLDDKSNGTKKKKETKELSISGSNVGATGTSTNNSSKKDDARNEFTSWCIKALSSIGSSVDVPTFISFLQDIESPFEVKDYIRVYLGETKDCTEFGKQFLERRSKYKNQQRAQNAHIDDMCVPAPAINPSSNEFQEVKGKGKKIKKSKMTKLDARILGFSVTAAQDRINVGDRDYGDAS